MHRYLGLVYHVITHAAHLRSYPIRPDETEDIAATVMLQVIDNDYATPAPVSAARAACRAT